MTTITIAERLKNELRKMGAAIVGFADLSLLPAEQRQGFNYGVSIAVTVDPAIFNSIGNGHTKENDNEYNRLNQLLDSLDLKAAEIISDAGFKAWPLTRAHGQKVPIVVNRLII
jgi:epoxyqueuosine reductase